MLPAIVETRQGSEEIPADVAHTTGGLSNTMQLLPDSRTDRVKADDDTAEGDASVISRTILGIRNRYRELVQRIRPQGRRKVSRETTCDTWDRSGSEGPET